MKFLRLFIMRLMREPDDHSISFPGTPPPVATLKRSTPQKHTVASSCELPGFVRGMSDAVKRASFDDVFLATGAQDEEDALCREAVSVSTSPFMNAQDFEEFRQLELRGVNTTADLGPFSVFNKMHVVEVGGNSLEYGTPKKMDSYASCQGDGRSASGCADAGMCQPNGTLNGDHSFLSEGVERDVLKDSEDDVVSAGFCLSPGSCIGAVSSYEDDRNVLGSCIGSAGRDQSSGLSTVASLAEKLSGGNSRGISGSVNTSPSGNADIPGSPLLSLRCSHPFNVTVPSSLGSGPGYSPSPPQSFCDNTGKNGRFVHSAVSVKSTPFLTGVAASPLFLPSTIPWGTLRSVSLDDGSSDKSPDVTCTTIVPLSSSFGDLHQASTGERTHEKPGVVQGSGMQPPRHQGVAEHQCDPGSSRMSWFPGEHPSSLEEEVLHKTLQETFQRDAPFLRRAAQGPPSSCNDSAMRLGTSGEDPSSLSVPDNTVDGAATEALRALYTTVHQGGGKFPGPSSVLLSALTQSPGHPAGALCKPAGQKMAQFVAADNKMESVASCASSATAHVAAAALVRQESRDLTQTLECAKTLLETCSAALDSARHASKGPEAHEGRPIENMLAVAVDAVASAVNVLAPGYLDMIAEEHCNSSKRPMMLAHPDEFKNPSSFLKIYGDPQCNAQQQNISRLHPRKSKDGNWECAVCKNVNYPRRFRCNNPRCKALRDPEGDKLVSDYARQVFHLYLTKFKYPSGNAAGSVTSAGCATSTNGFTSQQSPYIPPLPQISTRPTPEGTITTGSSAGTGLLTNNSTKNTLNGRTFGMLGRGGGDVNRGTGHSPWTGVSAVECAASSVSSGREDTSPIRRPKQGVADLRLTANSAEALASGNGCDDQVLSQWVDDPAGHFNSMKQEKDEKLPGVSSLTAESGNNAQSKNRRVSTNHSHAQQENTSHSFNGTQPLGNRNASGIRHPQLQQQEQQRSGVTGGQGTEWGCITVPPLYSVQGGGLAELPTVDQNIQISGYPYQLSSYSQPVLPYYCYYYQQEQKRGVTPTTGQVTGVPVSSEACLGNDLRNQVVIHNPMWNAESDVPATSKSSINGGSAAGSAIVNGRAGVSAPWMPATVGASDSTSHLRGTLSMQHKQAQPAAASSVLPVRHPVRQMDVCQFPVSVGYTGSQCMPFSGSQHPALEFVDQETVPVLVRRDGMWMTSQPFPVGSSRDEYGQRQEKGGQRQKNHGEKLAAGSWKSNGPTANSRADQLRHNNDILPRFVTGSQKEFYDSGLRTQKFTTQDRTANGNGWCPSFPLECSTMQQTQSQGFSGPVAMRSRSDNKMRGASKSADNICEKPFQSFVSSAESSDVAKTELIVRGPKDAAVHNCVGKNASEESGPSLGAGVAAVNDDVSGKVHGVSSRYGNQSQAGPSGSQNTLLGRSRGRLSVSSQLPPPTVSPCSRVSAAQFTGLGTNASANSASSASACSSPPSLTVVGDATGPHSRSPCDRDVADLGSTGARGTGHQRIEGGRPGGAHDPASPCDQSKSPVNLRQCVRTPEKIMAQPVVAPLSSPSTHFLELYQQ